MLLKTMELNLKQVSTEIGVSLAVCIAMMFLTMAMGAVSLLLGLIVIIIMLIRGYGRLFGASIFGEGAGGLMTLPVTSDELIAGKLLAAVIWAMALGIGFSGVVIIMVLVSGSASVLTGVFGEVAADLLDMGAAPWQIGILMAMLPFSLCLGAVFAGLCILTFQCVTRRKKADGRTGLLSRMSVGGITILAVILSTAFKSAGNWLFERLFEQLIGTFWLNAAVMALMIALSVVMYRFCRKTLSRQCDFD